MEIVAVELIASYAGRSFFLLSLSFLPSYVHCSEGFVWEWSVEKGGGSICAIFVDSCSRLWVVHGYKISVYAPATGIRKHRIDFGSAGSTHSTPIDAAAPAPAMFSGFPVPPHVMILEQSHIRGFHLVNDTGDLLEDRSYDSILLQSNDERSHTGFALAFAQERMYISTECDICRVVDVSHACDNCRITVAHECDTCQVIVCEGGRVIQRLRCPGEAQEITVNSKGIVYVAFKTNDDQRGIARFSADGQRLPDLLSVEANRYIWLAVDEHDRLWVAHDESIMVAEDGVHLTVFAATPGLLGLGALALDTRRALLYVVDMANNKIRVYSY